MRKNTLFNILRTQQWMLDPQSAAAAFAVLRDMVGAARLKAEYPIIEYEALDDDEPDQSYYHYYLSHADDRAIPQGYLVSVVRLEGVMMRDGNICQYGTRDVAQWLLEGDAHKRVLGTILLTDSGGGAADSVRDLSDAITQASKPVVALCDGYMCSAAYYAASYCRAIIANDRRNMIGCIGTMIEISGYPQKSVDEDGMIHLRIYADGSEEKNSDYEAALQGDVRPIRENLLNPLAEDFRTDVKTNRPTATDDQLKGRTYFAQDVVGTLIDGIGGISAAVAKTIELSNQKIEEMTGFEQLQALNTCHDLEMVDGHVNLNGEQLAEIEQALVQGMADKASLEANAATATDQAETITKLTEENQQLRDQAAAKDAEIENLRTQLAESNHDTEENHQAVHNGNPAPADAEDPDAGLSPIELAKKHNEMFH